MRFPMSSDADQGMADVPPVAETGDGADLRTGEETGADGGESHVLDMAALEEGGGDRDGVASGGAGSEETAVVVPTSRFGLMVLGLLLLLRLVVVQIHAVWSFPLYFFGSYALIIAFIVREPAPLKDFSLILGRFRLAFSTGIIVGCVYGLASGFGVAYAIFGHPQHVSEGLVVPAILQSFFGVALIEETVFRGILLGQLRKWGIAPVDAIAVQAIIFATGQISALLAGYWVLALDALALGVVAGSLTVRYQTILGAVLASTFWNFLTLALLGGHVTF